MEIIFGILLKGSYKTLKIATTVNAVAAVILFPLSMYHANTELTISPGVMYKVNMDQI